MSKVQITVNKIVYTVYFMLLISCFILAPSIFGKTIKPKTSLFFFYLNYVFHKAAMAFLIPHIIFIYNSSYGILRAVSLVGIWQFTTSFHFKNVKDNWNICLHKTEYICDEWRAVDISGHCFLTTWILFYSLIEIKLLLKRATRWSHVMAAYILLVNFVFCANMVRTILFYHNAVESAIAISFSLFYYLLLYSYLDLGKK